MFIPVAVHCPGHRGLVIAFIGGLSVSVLVGLTIFMPMAWAARWHQHKPKGDFKALTTRYSEAKRYIDLAGIGSFGYLIGWWLTGTAFKDSSDFQGVAGSVSIVLAVLSFLVLLFAVGARTGIQKRLEIIKAEIEGLETKGANEGSRT
jgi:hypothetical protein